MKIQKSIKFLAIIALFFSFSFAAHAQGGGGQSFDPEHMAERETTRLVEKLTLDETQTAKVQEINLTYAKKMQEAREDNKGNREAMKEIRTAIDAEKTAELKQVLTEAQFQTYEEMQSKRGKGRGGRGSRRGK